MLLEKVLSHLGINYHPFSMVTSLMLSPVVQQQQEAAQAAADETVAQMIRVS